MRPSLAAPLRAGVAGPVVRREPMGGPVDIGYTGRRLRQSRPATVDSTVLSSREYDGDGSGDGRRRGGGGARVAGERRTAELSR